MTHAIRTLLRRAVHSPGFRRTARLIVGGGILVGVGAHVGADPFITGILSLNGANIVAALLLAAAATVAAAWRWQLIASRLGIPLRLPTAVGMYYQSQFVNMMLPGGIIGDIRRAVTRVPSGTRLVHAARAVAIERFSGQAVQLALTLMVLAYLGTEIEGILLPALGIGFGVVIGALAAASAASARVRRALLREAHELRAALGSIRTAVQVTIASVIVIGCHVATFTIATAAVGERVPVGPMLTLALVVLLGAGVPVNIGGWGPREGIAGWAFALTGFGASAGVAASTLFGVLAIISIAPGAIVAAVSAARRRGSKHAMPGTPHRTRPRESSGTPPTRTASILIPTALDQEEAS